MDEKVREQLIFIERKLSVEENHTMKDSLLCQAFTIVSKQCSGEMREAIQKILAAYRDEHQLLKERWD